MNFAGFFTLLIISVIVSAILHFILKLYIRPGMSSFISKVIIGYIGAWQGSNVFGGWLFEMNQIYIIPAALGCLALLVLMVDLVQTFKTK